MRKIFFSILMIAFTNVLLAQSFQYAVDNPIELGKVTWLRDYDEATSIADKTGKPIFLLFQEVPGCGNCTKYGNDILSHPLIVEAIEDNFTALAIFNNKKGHDGEVLKHFNEPSWNNPVVRFVNSYGKNIGPRIANFRSTADLLEAMVGVLKKNNSDVPLYLTDLLTEYRAIENGTEEMYLSMYCFWTGEKEIGKMNGVVSTEAGYMHGHEVVKVNYDSQKANPEKIAGKASKVKCADQVYVNTKLKTSLPTKKVGKYRKDKQDKYYLLNSKYRAVPMTEYQKMKVNSDIGNGKDPSEHLSPRQLYLLENGKIRGNHVNKEFVKTWYHLVGA